MWRVACAYKSECLQKPESVISHRAIDTCGCQSLDKKFWGANMGPQNDQCMLLTNEPFLHCPLIK